MLTVEPIRKIGKSKYDKEYHLLEYQHGVWKRVCTWFPVELEIIDGDVITCENCQVRQYDAIW